MQSIKSLYNRVNAKRVRGYFLKQIRLAVKRSRGEFLRKFLTVIGITQNRFQGITDSNAPPRKQSGRLTFRNNLVKN
jgi:hypothetical protein